MAAISDPNAIKFINEQVRPLAEAARALKARIGSLTTDWFAGLNNTITNTSDLIADGRENQGVSRITGADVTNLVGNLISAHDVLNDQIVQKPCVKPIEVR